MPQNIYYQIENKFKQENAIDQIKKIFTWSFCGNVSIWYI